METRILIGFLLVCAVAGSPTEEALNDGIFTPEDYALFKNTIAYVYDDNGNLVQVTFDEEYDDEDIHASKALIKDRVFFYLYTRNNPAEPNQLYVNDEDTLKNSNFDSSKPTRFVTHGWMNSAISDACTLVRDAYLQHGDYNVIVIDWSKMSLRPYIWASRHVKVVAEIVSLMIDFLRMQGMDLSQTTFVGHSLGAHIAGISARNAKGKISAVIGLDPALPGFNLAGPGSRISVSDAEYVEIIHTNGGLLGFLSAIGDADFYPNGGSQQIGCILDAFGACSHMRSYQFYAESVNSRLGFHARSCNNYFQFLMGHCEDKHTSIMGGYKQIAYARGKYYLKTESQFPFAKGALGLH